MQIPISLAFYLLATSASAFPIGFGLEIRKLSATTAAASSTKASQAKSAAVGSSASVLSPSTYNAIQISTGTAGNSKANADALFSAIDQSNLAGVSAEDLKIIQDTHDAAENAETEAFHPAIAAASGAAATALQVRYSIHGHKSPPANRSRTAKSLTKSSNSLLKYWVCKSSKHKELMSLLISQLKLRS